MSKKIICIIGENGSGKSTIYNYLLYKFSMKYNLDRLVINTTRDKRNYEKDGIDYHFVKPSVFYNDYISNIIEYRVYSIDDEKSLIYYTHKNDIETEDENSILVCAASPEQVKKYIDASENFNMNIFTIRIETILKERLLHIINRCDTDYEIEEALRRVRNEKDEFELYKDYIMNNSKIAITVFNDYYWDGKMTEIEEFIKRVISY